MHGVEKPTEHHTLLGFIVSDSCPKAVFGLKGQEFDKAIYVKGNLDNSRKSTTSKTHIQEKSIESKKSKKHDDSDTSSDEDLDILPKTTSQRKITDFIISKSTKTQGEKRKLSSQSSSGLENDLQLSSADESINLADEQPKNTSPGTCQKTAYYSDQLTSQSASESDNESKGTPKSKRIKRPKTRKLSYDESPSSSSNEEEEEEEEEMSEQEGNDNLLEILTNSEHSSAEENQSPADLDSDFEENDEKTFTENRMKNKRNRHLNRDLVGTPLNESDKNKTFIEDFTEYMKTKQLSKSTKLNATVKRALRHLFTQRDSFLYFETEQNKEFNLECLRNFNDPTFSNLKYPVDWITKTSGSDGNKGSIQ